MNEIQLYEQTKIEATHALQSRVFGLQGLDEAIVKVQAARQLGIGSIAAMEYLQVIQGKLTITPRGMLALALQRADITFDVKYEYVNGKVFSCTVSGSRFLNGREISHSETFTMDDARAAGLIQPKGNWEKYPKNMLKWRCLGYWLDIVCPDVIFLKRSDEFAPEGKYEIIDEENP